MIKRRNGTGLPSVLGNSSVTLRMLDTVWFDVCDYIRVQYHSLYSNRDSWRRLALPTSNAVYWSVEDTPFPFPVVQSFLQESQTDGTG